MVVTSRSTVATFTVTQTQGRVPNDGHVLVPSFWIPGFALLLPDQTVGRP